MAELIVIIVPTSIV